MEEIKYEILPVLALRGMVLFPGMALSFDVSRASSKAALDAAMHGDRRIYVVCQKDIKQSEVNADNLEKIGVVATVKQVLKLPNSNVRRVMIEGLYRAEIDPANLNYQGYMRVIAFEVKEPVRTGFSADYERALIRRAKDVFEQYAKIIGKIQPSLVLEILSSERAGKLADCIAVNIPLEWKDKQRLLEILNPVKRLEKLISILSEEVHLAGIEGEIRKKVQENIDSGQKEYYLREQLKVINEELGNDDDPEDEIKEYKDKIKAIGLSAENEEKLIKEADKLGKMSSGSQDAYVVRNYLDTVLSLPWNIFTEDSLDIKKARKVLERDHYGIEKVKQRILEVIALRYINPDIKGQIICLAGPPGVGKTSVARSLAEAMGRKYVRISLGGVHDEAEIRGHRRTYIGAMQGKIISAIKTAGTSNPLILLDEIDKLGSDYKGDPAAAMLEVLDSEQNFSFTDNYIDIPYDLSKVFFVTTANDVTRIPEPLYDRMEVIELSSYTAEEKFHIAKKHLFKKQLANCGFSPKQVKITDDAIRKIITSYTSEAGVRELDRNLSKLMRKAADEIVENNAQRVTFTVRNLKKYLGSEKYKPEKLLKSDYVGIVNGLAWTSVGGKVLRVEVNVFNGSGKIELTGSLGDVMKESCSAAISYIRTVADMYNVPSDFYKTKDIHIHFPAGATPKDGPSAGIAIATAILSALTNTPVKREVAMTGEITIKGRVLPIGGLREKSMGAYLAGVKKVLIPADNLPDLDDVAEVVKENVEFFAVNSLQDVFSQALTEMPSVTSDKKEKVIINSHTSSSEIISERV